MSKEKPIYKIGDELYCIPEFNNCVITGNYDATDYSKENQPDYVDRLVYSYKLNGINYASSYHWWAFRKKEK